MTNISFFPSLISKASIIGLSSSGYLFLVYILLPDHLYDPLITIFVPSIGIISYYLFSRVNGLKFLKKRSQEAITVNDIKITQDTGSAQDTSIAHISQQPSIDESLIQEMIDQKVSSIVKEFNNTKQQLDDSMNTINNVKGEIDELKKSLNELKNAFETTLVDLKAFQTEITNPLNFMRKYVDSIDIKALSDPLLPLQSNLKNKQGESVNDKPSEELKKGVNENLHANDLDEYANRFVSDIVTNSNISLASMMEMIATLGEFIKQFGANYHSILSTQCKILGIDKEREYMLYNIADTLSNSKISADTYIESLYRLATVLGIKDKKVDEIYTKLKHKYSKKIKR